MAYDARRAKEEAEERARQEKRERLRTRPEALRAHLEDERLRFHGHLDQFGDPGAAALQLLLASRDDMGEIERDAFAAIVRQLGDDPLDARPTAEPVPPTVRDLDTVELLVESYQRRQRAQLDDLSRRYGIGPHLRRLRRELDDGQLMSTSTVEGLESSARRDQETCLEQERSRLGYLDRRDREARDRRHQLGLATRIAHGPAALYPIIDRERLRICRRCDEIAYPDSEPSRDQYGSPVHRPASRCHFCGASDLAPWDERHRPQLEAGAYDGLLEEKA